MQVQLIIKALQEQRFEVLEWLQDNLQVNLLPKEHRKVLDARIDACRLDPTYGSSWAEVEPRHRPPTV